MGIFKLMCTHGLSLCIRATTTVACERHRSQSVSTILVVVRGFPPSFERGLGNIKLMVFPTQTRIHRSVNLFTVPLLEVCMSVTEDIKKMGREDFLHDAKKISQSIDPTINFEEIVEPILTFLFDSLDDNNYRFDLFASQNPKTTDKFIKKYVGKIIKGYNRRPSVASPIAITPVDDPAIIKLAKASEIRYNVSEIVHNYKIINRLTTLHGEVLEEYIFTKVENGTKWCLAWGESVRNTDFFNIETKKMVQVKNKDTTANSDAHKNKKILVDAGYDLEIWWRLKSRTGDTNWDALNEILGLASEREKLSEDDYHSFIDRLLQDNPGAFKLDDQDLIPSEALKLLEDIGKEISESIVNHNFDTEILPREFFMENISEDFFDYFDTHRDFSMKSYGVLFSTLKYYSKIYGEDWNNLVATVRGKLPHIPVEIDSIVSAIAPAYIENLLGELFTHGNDQLWAAYSNEKDKDLDKVWEEIYSEDEKKLFQLFKRLIDD